MAPGFAILANSVQIRWQNTDTPTPGVSNNSLSPATAHKLSSAAVGGIVFGAFCGVVILIRCCFFRPRRRVNGETGRSIKDRVEGRFSKPGLEGTIQNTPGVDNSQGLFLKPELGDTQVRSGGNARSRKEIAELDAVDIPEV
jgi:hypothetical protein